MKSSLLWASGVLLAFSLPVWASPLEAQYAQRGYAVLVERGTIRPDSNYSRILREAIALIAMGKTVEEASRQTGVNLAVLQKILRMGSPIPAVDPKTLVQAALPTPLVPSLQPKAVDQIPPPPAAAVPEDLPKVADPQAPSRPVIRQERAISIRKRVSPPRRIAKGKRSSSKKTSPKSPTTRYVEAYGMGYFDSENFVAPKKFKNKFRVVKDFFSEKPEVAAAEPTERLSPSQRALLDIQRRHPEVTGLSFFQKN